MIRKIGFTQPGNECAAIPAAHVLGVCMYGRQGYFPAYMWEQVRNLQARHV